MGSFAKIIDDAYANLKPKIWGRLLIGIALLAVAAFAIWSTLPDVTKERLLRHLGGRPNIVVRASSFVRPLDVAVGGTSAEQNFGDDVLHNAPPFPPRPNAAEFEFVATRSGQYKLKIEYATVEPRPAEIWINDTLALPHAMAEGTGGYEQSFQKLLEQDGTVTLIEGQNVMRVQSSTPFPHIRKFVFVPA